MAASVYAKQFVGYGWSNSVNLRYSSKLGVSCWYLSSKIVPSLTTVREKSFYSRESENIQQGLPIGPPTLLANYPNLKTLNTQSTSYHSLSTINQASRLSQNVLSKSSHNSYPPHRNYSGGGEEGIPDKKVVMHLMDFPEIVWPSLIKSLRNWILSNLIITPYFDREFNLTEFIDGSKKAFEMVTECLSESNFDKLIGLVSPEALEELKQNISLFSVQKRQELRMLPEDIYFCFPYQVGVMFSDDDENQKRFVEITMCFHVLQGLTELKSQGITPPINMGMMPEYRDKIHICNYRFIREFTKGVEGGWTINKLNHFKPSDYIT